MMNSIQKEIDAIKLLRKQKIGILSTHSTKYKGFPFGSFITYCSSKDRTIYFYLSDLAEHTKNINLNSKASFTIFEIKDNSNDLQDSKRLTLLGQISKISKDNDKNIRSHFFDIFPESKKYDQAHDFNFYKFSIEKIRWIGGFGKITWLDSKMWLNIELEWEKAEKGIISHMNRDHSESIVESLKSQHNVNDIKARMLTLSMDGYYVNSNDKIYFIQFEKPCLTRGEYKDELVRQSKLYLQKK